LSAAKKKAVRRKASAAAVRWKWRNQYEAEQREGERRHMWHCAFVAAVGANGRTTAQAIVSATEAVNAFDKQFPLSKGGAK
jgi:hypothetical protein